MQRIQAGPEGIGEGAEGIQMSGKNQPGVPQKGPESQGRVAAQDGHQWSSPVVPEPASQPVMRVGGRRGRHYRLASQVIEKSTFGLYVG